MDRPLVEAELPTESEITQFYASTAVENVVPEPSNDMSTTSFKATTAAADDDRPPSRPRSAMKHISVEMATRPAWDDSERGLLDATPKGRQTPTDNNNNNNDGSGTSLASNREGHMNNNSQPLSAVPLGLRFALDSPRTSLSGDSAPFGRGTSSALLLDGTQGSSTSKHPPPKRIESVSELMKFIAVGDNLVEDRWQPSSGSGKAFQESGSVMPTPSSSMKGTEGSVRRQLSEISVAVIEKTISFRTLVWYYFQTFLYSIVVASPIYPITFALSRIPWHIDNPIPGDFPVWLPNNVAITWTMFMQTVVSLSMYAIVLYMAMNRTLRVPWQLVTVCSLVTVYSLISCLLYWHFNFAFWYYYLDVVLIVTVYLPCAMMVGWLSAGEDATTMQRIYEVVYVAILEAIIATAAIVYAIFIMPNFYTLKSAWLQLLWACVLHPLYFELTTAAIVRKTLHRQVSLGRREVVHFLPVVHMNVHQVGMAFSLQASIEPTNIIVLSLFCLQVGKLLWRSTVLWRDLFIERMWRRQWSFQYDPEHRAELTKIISLAVMTELILDNAAIVSAPFMLWVMYREPIFMSVVPNTFFKNDGEYPVGTMFIIIALMLAFTWVGDIVFFTINYNWGQCLPIIYTWRRIKNAKWAYLGFLCYALATMGVTFNFAMLLLLPRASYCKTNDYCNCSLKSYDAICEGEYFSMLVDYLVGGSHA